MQGQFLANYNPRHRRSFSYLPQNFTQPVAKVSKKGWTVHERLLELDSKYLKYFRKVPSGLINFESVSKINSNGPKVIVDISRIKQVRCNIQEDEKAKSFRKLKQPGSFFKIVFYSDGAIYPGKDIFKNVGASPSRSKSIESIPEDQQYEDALQNKTQSVLSSQIEWYFKCQSDEIRDELVTKIYINAYQLIERQDDLTKLDQLACPETLETVKQTLQYINMDEREQKQIRRRLNLNANSESPHEEEASETDDSLQARMLLQDDFDQNDQSPGVKLKSRMRRLSSGDDEDTTEYRGSADEIQESSKSRATRRERSTIKSEQQNRDNSPQKSQYERKNKKGLQAVPSSNDLSPGIHKVTKKRQQSVKNIAWIQQHPVKKRTPEQVSLLSQVIDQINQAESHLQNKMRQREKECWDLKFQNLWSLLIQHSKNEKTLHQHNPIHHHEDDPNFDLEALVNHIGEFREHVEQIVVKIIDQIHIPLECKLKPNQQINQQDLENKNNTSPFIRPIPVQNLENEQLIYLDEHEPGLFKVKQKNSRSEDPADRYSLDGINYYLLDNIFFKITNRNEILRKSSSFYCENYKYFDLYDDPDTENSDSEGEYVDQNDLQSQKQNKLSSHKQKNTYKKFAFSTQDSIMHIWKLFGLQFLSLNSLFDTIHKIETQNVKISEQFTRFRIPLSILVDYKGFRCIAIANPPVQLLQIPTLGFHNDQYIPVLPEIKDDLKKIGDSLHLKQGIIINKKLNTEENSPLSDLVKVYKLSRDNIGDLEKNLSLPSQSSSQYHYKQLNLSILNNLYYIVKTSQLFPSDITTLTRSHFLNPHHLLRPEFLSALATSNQVRISGNALKGYRCREVGLDGGSKGGATDDVKHIQDASDFLRDKVLTNFVKSLENLDLLPIDSVSLRKMMKDHGLNMRYLGHICLLTSYKHIREICVTEMLARTIKNVFNTKLSELLMENQIEHRHLVSRLQQIDRELFRAQKNQQIEHDHQQIKLIEQLSDEKITIENEIRTREQLDHSNEIDNFIIDFMNLVFGSGSECDYFWNNLLIPLCIDHFSLKHLTQFYKNRPKIDQIIDRSLLNYIHLFYAVIQNLNLMIDLTSLLRLSKNKNLSKKSQAYQHWENQQMCQIFELFGKSEAPFGEVSDGEENGTFLNTFLVIAPKSKVYGLQTTLFGSQIDAMNQLVSESNYEEVLKIGEMRLKMYQCLNQTLDTQTLASLASLALTHSNPSQAILYSEQALECLMPLHATRVQFYSIFMRAYYKMGQVKEADSYFQMALTVIRMHLGQSHPLQIQIRQTMAQLLIPKNQWEEALKLYQESMICSLSSLGPNHIQTAKLHYDLGQFYLKWNKLQSQSAEQSLQKKEEALSYFEQAYLIFEKNYDNSQEYQEKTSVIADAAMNIAEIIEEQGRRQEAQNYVEVAFKKYTKIYGSCSDSTLLAHWQLLQLQYSHSFQIDDSVVHLADTLQLYLYQRDQKVGSKQWKERVSTDQLKEHFVKIKIYCIITLILEMTRIIPINQAQLLESFCDNVLTSTSKPTRRYSFSHLAQLKKEQVDLLSIKRVKTAAVRTDKKTQQFFLSLYQKSANSKERFRGFYKEMLKQAISFEASKQKKSSNNTQNKSIQQNIGKSNQNTEIQIQNLANKSLKSLDLSNTQTQQEMNQDKIDQSFQRNRRSISFERSKKDNRQSQDKQKQIKETEIFFEQLIDSFQGLAFYSLLTKDV